MIVIFIFAHLFLFAQPNKTSFMVFGTISQRVCNYLSNCAIYISNNERLEGVKM